MTSIPNHHSAMHSNDFAQDPSTENSIEKSTDSTPAQHLENIRTVSRVPNPHYYEKDGLRTYGDDEDHEHEPPASLIYNIQ